MVKSKTMQIFSVDSDSNGIKIAELSVNTAKVHVTPQNKFDDKRTNGYISGYKDNKEPI